MKQQQKEILLVVGLPEDEVMQEKRKVKEEIVNICRLLNPP